MAVKDRPIVHLFCNAHIDPVWMWGWEEGAREAISTFRTAVDLLGEYPEFVFNHNESLLYEWVEEYDPWLFERIRDYVRQGRWNITGGWYLQPDCNLVGGETLVRLILEGRRYFDEKFGVRSPVSYNFDTFGHPGTIPQLLKQSGFEMYIHCRPTAAQLDLPAPLRRWRGADGTEVLAIRPNSGWYCTPGDGQAQTQAREGVRLARESGQDVLVTWGLGDHGGGATRGDLNRFREIIAEFRDSDVEVRHSTPEAYLARVKTQIKDLPVHEGEIQRTLMGCYTSVAPIKREMREGEALLASAERWAAIAWWRYGHRYPADDLRVAWKRLMFNTFHDVLAGSLLEDALPGVMDNYGYAQDVARRIITRSQHAMLPNLPPQEGSIPVFVLNPHSAPMKAYVGLNFMRDYRQWTPNKPYAVFDETGTELACQPSGGHSIVLETGGGSIVNEDLDRNPLEGIGAWVPYVGFVADVPPLSARRYELRYQKPQAAAGGSLEVSEDAAGITVENRWWRVRFARDSAAPVELVDKSSGRNLLKAPLQLFAMHDVAHAWGGEDRAVFNQPAGALTALAPDEVGSFTGMEGKQGPALRVLTKGRVSAKVECLVGWQHTRASLSLTLYADLPYIDIDTRLYMQARRKMMKLVFPFDLPVTRAVVEAPYGTAERPADATEYPYARWIRLESGERAVGVANNGQNGLDVSADGVLGLSVSRGAVHCHWEETADGLDTSRSYTFMDQGQIDTRFRLLAGSKADVAAQLVDAALDLNQPLERFFAFYPPHLPPDAPAQPLPFLHVEPATVALGALKQSEDGKALVVRLVEMIGKKTAVRVKMEDGAEQTMTFGPHEIKTFRVERRGPGVVWTESNLLET